jgi:hypothetical protein
VCCDLGNLFNKESILHALLEKTLPDCFGHIRGMKDIKSLRFTANPARLTLEDEDVPAFICPVTKMEFNGLQPFIALWSTGFVLSEKAIKEVGIDGLQDEYGPFTTQDIIKLVPLESEMDAQRTALLERRLLRKSTKSSSKGSAGEENETGERKKSHKKRKHEDEDAEEEGKQASSNTKISSAEVLVKTATNSIKEHEEKSSVYKSLFHKGNEKDRKDRDLFMTVAGLRYTLG